MIDWIAASAFLTAAVEWVEAFTSVLAGSVRQQPSWRRWWLSPRPVLWCVRRCSGFGESDQVRGWHDDPNLGHLLDTGVTGGCRRLAAGGLEPRWPGGRLPLRRSGGLGADPRVVATGSRHAMRALCKALFGDVHNVAAVGVVMATGVALIRAGAGAATVYPIPLLVLAGVAWLAKP